MSTTAADRYPVSFPELARELGLSGRQRSELLREQLVTPVNTGGVPHRGTATWITPESADYLTKAKRIVEDIKSDPDARKLAVGITIIVVLRLLLSGAVKPSLF